MCGRSNLGRRESQQVQGIRTWAGFKDIDALFFGPSNNVQPLTSHHVQSVFVMTYPVHYLHYSQSDFKNQYQSTYLIGYQDCKNMQNISHSDKSWIQIPTGPTVGTSLVDNTHAQAHVEQESEVMKKRFGYNKLLK